MLLNFAYLFMIALLSPWLLWRTLRTGRYRRDLRVKLAGCVKLEESKQYTVWFHGVSVGEIHLLVTLVAAYRKRYPEHRVVVSSTTDTGLAEARKKFENVIVWPFDFTWAVANAIDTVKPNLIVLAEAEMWPNFLRAANARGIPVAVINARLSPRSFRRYSRIAGFARRVFFDRVSVIAVQGEDYAERFRALGVPADKVIVSGSIKYDGALKERSASILSALLPKGESTIWVAGSTHAPEEAIVLDAFAKLRGEFPKLRLILVPRHPDRFDEVARLLENSGLEFVRRSRMVGPPAELPPVVLLDTIGELGAAWGLADLGYVGGTLEGNRGGQSMIEPAGYGVPTVFGPQVWNFREAAQRLVECGGAAMIQDKNELVEIISKMLRNDGWRLRMGTCAREYIASQQGATCRTLDIIFELAYTLEGRQAA